MAALAGGQDAMCSVVQSVQETQPHDQEAMLGVLQVVYDSVGASRTALSKWLSESVPGKAPASTLPSVPEKAAASTTQSSVSLRSSESDDAAPGIAALRRQASADKGLSSVAGMAQAKQLLTEAVVLPMRYRHLFTGARKPWRSVLLFGPPGTGKSRLALAVAAEVGAEMYAISPADLLSSWFGQTEQNIRELFDQLRQRSRDHRVIVFLDEVDGLCRRRSHDENETTRRMKTELLTQLQEGNHDAVSSDDGQLFFVCATNCPWEIDPAFLRRFQLRIFINLPDRASRQELIRTLSASSAGGSADLSLLASEWQRLLDTTEGFSGSDLEDLVRNALYQPVRELAAARYWRPAGRMWMPCESSALGAVRKDLQNLPPDVVCARSISIQDFIDVMRTARPTVCAEDLARYERFTEQFGQIG